MTRLVKTGIAVLVGVAIGAGSMEALRAQATPPAYLVSEITVKDLDPYMKEFVPARRKAIQDAGGIPLVRGADPKVVVGESPGGRVAISQYESIDKLLAFTQSASFKETEALGEKYGTIRIYAVEGIAK